MLDGVWLIWVVVPFAAYPEVLAHVSVSTSLSQKAEVLRAFCPAVLLAHTPRMPSIAQPGVLEFLTLEPHITNLTKPNARLVTQTSTGVFIMFQVA